MERNTTALTIPAFLLDEAWFCSYILVKSLHKVTIHIVVLLKKFKIHVQFMQT